MTNVTHFHSFFAGGEAQFNNLPQLDLGSLGSRPVTVRQKDGTLRDETQPAWLGTTSYPDSVAVDRVTSPIMRAINGFPDYEYLLVKYSVRELGSSEKSGIYILFASNKRPEVMGCFIHGSSTGLPPRDLDTVINDINIMDGNSHTPLSFDQKMQKLFRDRVISNNQLTVSLRD